MKLLRAIVLGLLQGPTEMAPVSSSAHTSILRSLWGAQPSEGAAARKSFEVALHGGTAVALALSLGGELRSAAGRIAAARRLALLALSAAPPALAGYVWERPIERRLGGSQATATGLLAGGLAMAIADRRAQERTIEQARALDGLALGLAQAAALVPGVSRRGATLAAARALRFSRDDADLLSWLAAVPVILGACALKGVRPRAGEPAELIAGAGASFCSTLVAAELLKRTRLRSAPLAPFAAYRCIVAIALLKGPLAAGSRIFVRKEESEILTLT